MSPIILILLMWNCSLITSFHIKSHFPVSNSSRFPRLRMVESLPSLQQFTMCSWLKFYSNNNQILTVVSYDTSITTNQVMLSLIKQGSDRVVKLFIGEPYTIFKCNSEWKVGEWYHLCANWFSSTATAEIYQNGNICHYAQSNKPFEKTIIPSGGILIIGQDQDGMDAKYDANQSWYGDIADLQIWDEKLSIYQIQETGKCNGKMKAGNVFSWMKTRLVAIDNVIFSETQLCYP